MLRHSDRSCLVKLHSKKWKVSKCTFIFFFLFFSAAFKSSCFLLYSDVIIDIYFTPCRWTFISLMGFSTVVELIFKIQHLTFTGPCIVIIFYYINPKSTVYVYTRDSTLKLSSSTLETEWSQHDYLAACVTARQNAPSTFIQSAFSYGKKNRRAFQFFLII